MRCSRRMEQYHVIFIPCSGGSHTDALRDPNVLRNIRDYVAAGGKLYVTDWSGEWFDNVFPLPIELGGGVDTPANAYDPDTDTWNTWLFGNADGSAYDTSNAEAVDEHLRAWLDGQQGPTPQSGSPTVYDAAEFFIEGNWNYVTNVLPRQVGIDEDGEAVINEPHVYVIGGQEWAPLPKRPMTLTFEPAGCGRVLFSTYHTTDTSHVGLTPQERILVYLIMEIGVCHDPKLDGIINE